VRGWHGGAAAVVVEDGSQEGLTARASNGEIRKGREAGRCGR
jgi:hypothetical protein